MPLDPKRAGLYSQKIAEYQATVTKLETRLEDARVHYELDETARRWTARDATEATEAATVSTNQLLKLGTAVGIVTKVFDTASGVIRGNTLVAFREEARARGELSASLRLETQSRLQAIPLIGKLAQVISESYHQKLGTEYMARAAGVVEGAIPGLRGAITGTRVSAAAGGIRERWMGEPERAYQMQLLGIRAGPGAVAQGVEEASNAAFTEVKRREQALVEAKQAIAAGGKSRLMGTGVEQSLEVARSQREEQLSQAQALLAQFQTPHMLALRSELAGGIRTLQQQAREEYVREFGRNLDVTNVPAWYSLAAGARPGVAPGEDTQIAQLQTLGTIADLLRDALKGINPAVMAP